MGVDAHIVRRFDVLLSVLSAPPAMAGLYVAGLAAVSCLSKSTKPVPRRPPLTVAIVVPAHNEALHIASTVASLLDLDYPATGRQIWVLADNCTDNTAERAIKAGAQVIERQDRERRGKGHALSDTFPRVLADDTVECLVVVDADTTVSRNLLWEVSDHLQAGAPAAQARYGVANPDGSWRTRLLHIALSAFHDVRSLGRERLGLSCGLRGNGMGFSRAALEAVPHRSAAIVEDAEYGIRLGVAGMRVAYLHNAVVLGDMPLDERSSRIQRSRWEGGRVALRRMYAAPLSRSTLQHGLSRRGRMTADLLIDLLVPPLGQLVAALVGLLTATVVVGIATGQVLVATWLAAAGLIGVAFYVLSGWARSHTGLSGLRDLAFAPVYVAWKLIGNRGGSRPPKDWVRTPRSGEADRNPHPASASAD